jgi:hypothetical protein
MTSIPPFITAKVISNQDARLVPGRGCVEKTEDDGRIVIALASGKITARCTSGSLSPGDIVFVRFHGNNLIIERGSPRGYGAVRDEIDLRDNRPVPSEPVSGTGDGAPSNPGRGTGFSLSGSRTPAEGFYFFDTAEKAVSWLSEFSAEFGKKDRRAILEKFAQEPVVIQVVATEKEGAKALIVPRESADARLASFVREQLRSGRWEALLPEGGLMPLLKDRGALSAQRLIALDAMLSACDALDASTPPGTQAGKFFSETVKPGRSQLFAQWLNVAMDETIPLSAFSSSPPAQGCAELPLLLEQIKGTAIAGTEGVFKPLMSEKDYSVNRSILENPPDKPGALPRILERIGLNFENALLHSETPAESPAPSVKLQLLHLENELQSILPQRGDASSEHPALLLHRSTLALSSDLLGASGRLLTALFPSEVEHTFSQEVVSPGPPQASAQTAGKRLLYSFRQWVEKTTVLCEDVSRKILDKAEKIRNAIGLFDAIGKDTPDAGPAAARKNGLPSDVATDMDASVRSFALRAAAAFKKIDEALSALSRRFETGIGEEAFFSRSGSEPADRETHMRLQVQSSMREIAHLASGELRDLFGRADRLAAAASKILDAAGSGGGNLDAKPGLETTRQLVETALQRIESMQVSAKPTLTGDVRQQVVMVPMNIDGVWNDVIMKFVRASEHGEKKNGRKDIFVTINVAPSALGEIAASIDYKGAGTSSLRMEFDEDRTLSWFESNRRELTDAFAGIGLKGLKIELRKNARHEGAVGLVDKPPADGAIDIVA